MIIFNLEALGFDSNCNKVYNYLLNNVSRLTAKNISENLNIPSKAVYAALKSLESSDLIETFEDEYPKLFSVQNPNYSLSQLVENQIEKREEAIRIIKAELDKANTAYLNQFIRGSCKRQVSFFYFRDTSLASSFLSRHLSEAQSEILVNLIPKYILTNFTELLNLAAHNGVWVGIYITKKDLEIIHELEDHIKAFIVDSSDQHYVSIDNQLFSSGNILIDRKRFVAIDYDPQDGEWMLNSFVDYRTVESIKDQIRKRAFQDARDILESQELKQDIVLRITKLLSEKGNLSKQELAYLLQISGKQLNEALKKLEDNNSVQIQKVSKGKGRPQDRVYLRGV